MLHTASLMVRLVLSFIDQLTTFVFRHQTDCGDARGPEKNTNHELHPQERGTGEQRIRYNCSQL